MANLLLACLVSMCLLPLCFAYKNVGCYDFKTDDFDFKLGALSAGAKCYSNPKEQNCCAKGFKAFALGGYWRESKLKTDHNQWMCFNDLPKNAILKPVSECDQACPGNIHRSGNVNWSTENGMCGGGCQGCSAKFPGHCTSNPNIPCGYYWSYYTCSDNPSSHLVPDYSSIESGSNNQTLPQEELDHTHKFDCSTIVPESPGYANYCQKTACEWCTPRLSHFGSSMETCLKQKFGSFCEVPNEAASEPSDISMEQCQSGEVFEPTSFRPDYCKSTVCSYCSNHALGMRKCIEQEFQMFCTLKPQVKPGLVDEATLIRNCEKVIAPGQHEFYCKTTYCSWCANKHPKQDPQVCIKEHFSEYCEVQDPKDPITPQLTAIDCSKLHAVSDPFYEVYCRETVCAHCNENAIPQDECLQTAYWLPSTCKME